MSEQKQPSPLLPSDNPLTRAETEIYVNNQKSADFNRNISGYMFWGATSILGALAVGMLTSGIASIGVPLIIGAVAASAATFLGSVYFSGRATEINERSNVLYSDIDSQNQARRMVQAFARAQSAGRSAAAVSPVQNDMPLTDSGVGSWAERTGTKAALAEDWQTRVAAEADLEDQRALQDLSSR